MSEPSVTIVADQDPYPNEYWTETQHHRWAALDETTTEPPVLQVAWRSSYGRIKWRRIETVVVSRDEYKA